LLFFFFFFFFFQGPGDPNNAATVVACSSTYGYGTLAFYNETTAYWNFTAQPTPIGTSNRMPMILQDSYNDYAWIVRA
jgi:Iron/zinc purple acid phosphatase-like protein C